jgi:hypothetical protein
MAYAIIRIGKLKNRDIALSATAHNYRTQDTPNADPLQFSRNQELLNHEQRNYWDLANERIEQLHLTRQRKDAIRCVEILMTASSEGFARDKAGRALDMRGKQWVQNNLQFLEKTFGRENIVSFTLHQDETTPHIHAVIVPVTREQRLHKGERVGATERLSCRELFSPSSLRQLQTDYAEAMAPHGFERGIKYSTAIHEDVRRHYGAQQMSKEALTELVAPVVYQPGEATKIPWHVNSDLHLQREVARLNQQAAAQVEAANAKLVEVAAVASANALAHDKVRVLEKQLASSKEREQRTAAVLAQKTKELAEKQQQLSTSRTRVDHLLIAVVQGDKINPKLLDQARQQREQSRQRAENLVGGRLYGPVVDGTEVGTVLREHGYTLHKTGEGQVQVRETQTQARFLLTELRPHGRELREQVQQAIQRTKNEQEQARREALAQEKGAKHAYITASSTEQAGRIQAGLEQAGANVWQVQPLEAGRVGIQVSYCFDLQTIEGISHVLDKVQRSTGVTLEEEQEHRRVRTNAVASLERQRTPPERSQGLEL